MHGIATVGCDENPYAGVQRGAQSKFPECFFSYHEERWCSRFLARNMYENFIRIIYKVELAATLLRNVPGSAAYFVTLNQFKYLVLVGSQRWPKVFAQLTSDGRLSSTGNLVVGAAARTAVGFALMPLTVAKVRFESSSYSSYNSVPSALRSIVKSEGLAGLFRGWGATALRDAPYAGLYLVLYERLKTHLDHFGALRNITAGLIAGVTATVITHPFDVARTRIQLYPAEYKNLSRALRLIGRDELLRGLWPRLLRKSLNSALTWAIYEELMALLATHDHKE